jgi:methylamine dehydrogenase accessory protein MauD
MIEALIVSNVVLWVVVVGLAAVVLALTRQIGILHERVAPAGALAAERGPRVGESAPVLEVDDWQGTRRTLGGAAADGTSTLLFFLSPTCPVCKTLLPTLRSVMRAEGESLRLVLASDGERSEHEAFVREHGLETETYVLSTPLGLAYQVAKLPYAVLVDAAGVVRAKGIVNTREHLESLFEARERGVGSIQEFVQRRGGRRVA